MMNDVFKRVLVVSPHADDEVIGCGGVIKKVVNMGGEVFVVVVSIGDINFYHLDRVVTKEERKEELRHALNYLGVTGFCTLFDDYESLMDTMPIRNIISALDNHIDKIKPTTVLLPYPSFHQDHKIVFNAGFAALRPSPRRNGQLKLTAGYEYPFVTWTNETLQTSCLYVNITDEIDDKIEALRCHKSQLRESGHLISPESVRLWAEKRGMDAGCPYSEMFYVLRLRL
ncbi:MAG: PIG-L deacetylase family protein [Bacillota bacterium]